MKKIINWIKGKLFPKYKIEIIGTAEFTRDSETTKVQMFKKTNLNTGEIHSIYGSDNVVKFFCDVEIYNHTKQFVITKRYYIYLR